MTYKISHALNHLPSNGKIIDLNKNALTYSLIKWYQIIALIKWFILVLPYREDIKLSNLAMEQKKCAVVTEIICGHPMFFV
jgi:hypothetical protein